MGVSLALAAVAVGTPGAAGGAPAETARVKAPKRGQYIGATRRRLEASLFLGRRTIKRSVFEARCGIGTGRTSIGRVKLRRTKRGFRFTARRSRRITYNDGHAPETARVVVSGRFTRGGRKVRGRVRIRSRHCGRTGNARWLARYTSPPVRAPKDGKYAGLTRQRRDLEVYVSGRSIELAVIEFKCGDATGTTVLNDIDMRRTFRGFAFVLRAHGSVGYSDGHPDENGEVDISGRFSRSGSKARGRIRVKTRHCGGTGQVSWTAKRRRGG